MDFSFLAAPVIGAIIGYVTNDIAIRMLFKPVEPKYIGKFHVPFTPGIIPKEKSRLAEAVGKAVADNLLAADVVTASLLSDRIIEKINVALDELVEKARGNEKTVAEILREKTDPEKFDATVTDWKGKIADILTQKLMEADVGTMAAKGATEYAKKKSPALFSNIVHGLMDDRLKQSIQGQIRDTVNGCVRENAEGAIRTMVENESTNLLDTRLTDVVTKYEDRLPAIREKLLQLYKSAVTSSMEKVLASMDIALIIREKIESIDNRELESMIRNVVNNELKAIVWFGAGLGFLMGLVNLLVL